MITWASPSARTPSLPGRANTHSSALAPVCDTRRLDLHELGTDASLPLPHPAVRDAVGQRRVPRAQPVGAKPDHVARVSQVQRRQLMTRRSSSRWLAAARCRRRTRTPLVAARQGGEGTRPPARAGGHVADGTETRATGRRPPRPARRCVPAVPRSPRPTRSAGTDHCLARRSASAAWQCGPGGRSPGRPPALGRTTCPG